MNKKCIVMGFVAILTIALCAMNPPSRLQELSREEESSAEGLSESSGSESISLQEQSVRERPVKRLKTAHVPTIARPELDRQAETLIERAAAPEADIDAFFLDITDKQIRVINKIMFFNKRGQVAYLFDTEQATFDALPEFVKQLFRDATEEESGQQQQESNRDY